MTTITELIRQLGAAGIKLWLDEESLARGESQLRFKAPKGALTPELKERPDCTKRRGDGFFTAQ
jgi:hypothetical protein